MHRDRNLLVELEKGERRRREISRFDLSRWIFFSRMVQRRRFSLMISSFLPMPLKETTTPSFPLSLSRPRKNTSLTSPTTQNTFHRTALHRHHHILLILHHLDHFRSFFICSSWWDRFLSCWIEGSEERWSIHGGLDGDEVR